MMEQFTLGFGATFSGLASRDGLIGLDRAFLGELLAQDAPLQHRLLAARAAPEQLDVRAEADLVVAPPGRR
jgi:hypothetical protein